MAGPVKAFGTYSVVGPTFPISFSSFTGSLASYTTALNDCLVVAMGAGNGASTFTSASGCGATWVVNYQAQSGGGAYSGGLSVGYACTAGGSSLSFTGAFLAGNTFEIAVAVLAGAQSSPSPITGTAHGTSSLSTTTTGSLSYSAGQLLVIAGGGAAGAGAWQSTSWSNGATNTHIVDSDIRNLASLDYIIPSSGSSTTVTMTRLGGGTTAYAAALTGLFLTNQGDMFLVL